MNQLSVDQQINREHMFNELLTAMSNFQRMFLKHYCHSRYYRFLVTVFFQM